MRTDYTQWLRSQGYVPATVDLQIARIQRIERAYGSLDDLSPTARESLIGELTYSTADGRNGRPNPSRIELNGDIRTGLQSIRDAARRYFRFLIDTYPASAAALPGATASSDAIEQVVERLDERQRISLERDMQAFLRRNIESVEPGLRIIDEGAERFVDSGRIDILCVDRRDSLVVLELKAGTADARAIGQILGYMGDIAAEEGVDVRGLLIAHDFDKRSRSAARAVNNLELRTYSVSFHINRIVD